MGRHRLSLFCACVLFLIAVSAIADDKVGTVKFETSCSPAVQADFERAVGARVVADHQAVVVHGEIRGAQNAHHGRTVLAHAQRRRPVQ